MLLSVCGKKPSLASPFVCNVYERRSGTDLNPSSILASRLNGCVGHLAVSNQTQGCSAEFIVLFFT